MLLRLLRCPALSTACCLLAGLLTLPSCAAQVADPTAPVDWPDDLTQCEPWYPHQDLPPLKTPTWVGEPGVDAVVVLAIDDMRDPAKYEAYLRPILNRLKQIDGRAPVSIMTCSVNPEDPQLQSWLEEGLSLEVHTVDHPCPLLQAGDLAAARSTYERCVDLLARVPGNQPVAFRMPCCDSLNTVSPRFYAEIFNRTTPAGNYLQLDSSVFNFFTSADPSIPRELVLDERGQERFLKYVVRGLKRGEQVHDHYVNYITNYPYPYVINGSCWQFPCVAPSDWSAQHRQGVNHPQTVADWKAALDITVQKQGVFNLVFHPHGWIQAEQIVELIEHAVSRHGSRVKFLNFREAADRLNRALSNSAPLRQLPPAQIAQLSHSEFRRQSPGPNDAAALPADIRRLLTAADNGLPPLRRSDGSHNGFFRHGDWVCWQNEDTAVRPDLIQRVSLQELRRQARTAASAELPPVPVGAAVVDVTPDYPVRLTGYGNRRVEADKAAARIHARALVIGGDLPAARTPDGTAAGLTDVPLTVLVTVDNCGVPAEITEAVFRQLSQRFPELHRERFVLSSTHTHSGPWLTGFAPLILNDVPTDQLARLQQYAAELTQHLADVVVAAVDKRCLARLSVGRGQAGFAMNRRALQNGQWTGFGEVPDGPVDHHLPVLAAHAVDGQLLAVLASYACHATTETGEFNQISGDWPGIAADLLEAEHPGAVALVAIGCGADANPSPRGTHEQARQHGATVAREVRRLLHSGLPGGAAAESAPTAAAQSADALPDLQPLRPVDPRLVCRIDRVDLPLGPLPSRAEWEQRVQQSGAAGAHARRFLAMLDAGQPVPTVIPDYPIQTWCFGDDLAMVFLGGEVVVDYAIRLNEMFDADRLWINAYSNDVPCYIASRRLLREGGYEVDSSMLYYARPTRLAPEAEDLICDTVQRLLPHTFYSESLQVDYPGPRSPEDALASMSTRPDLRVELVASEPLLADPVAFDWDVQGRLWVVEMGDYPRGREQQSGHAAAGAAADPGVPVGGGRVRVLEDANGDGRYDTARTFLEQLAFPSGICCWRDGVLITAAPDVLYAADTDGDGVADQRVTLFTGFTEGNQQHRVNGLRWGLDGWLYLANGDSGGQIRWTGQTPLSAANGMAVTVDPERLQPVDIRGRDLRIQPDTGRIEAVSGQTQFGRERDDFGHWFGNNNSNPIWQYLLEDHYLKRNPQAAAATVRADVAEVPGAAPVFPTSRTLSRFNDFQSANRFTSACSTMIYRDHWLGEAFYGNAFTSEPVHNLVSRLVLTRQGAGFRGQRAADEAAAEVLASSDNWFRPTMLRTGPDGALYIADMYRQVIEHPEWIPPEYQRRMDLQAGNDRGRIYRLVPARGCCGSASAGPEPEPADLRGWFQMAADQIPTAALVERLASPNGWWRDTAQRLLAQRQDVTALDGLTALASAHASAAVRVQALSTVQLLTEGKPGGVAAPLLLKALSDQSPDVRVAALRLLEPALRDPRQSVPQEVARLADDPDAGVLLQLACTLGECRQPEAAQLLARVLLAASDDRWIVAGVFSALRADNVAAVLQGWSQLRAESAAADTAASAAVFARLLGQAAAFRQTDAVRAPFKGLLIRLNTDVSADSSASWLAATEVTRSIRRIDQLAEQLRQSADLSEAWTNAVQRALQVAEQPTALAELRAAAVQFAVASGGLTEAELNRLLQLLQLQTPLSVQQAVVAALSTADHPDMPQQLLARWNSFGPALRSAVLNLLLQKEPWTSQLLDAIDGQVLTGADLDAVQREQLLNHRNAPLRSRAATLLAGAAASTRSAVIDEWRERLVGHTGQADAGREVFEKRCSACHRLQGIGKSIGADLQALKDRSSEALLTAILDPNRAVESKFFSYTAVTREGLSISGMLLNETGNSLTLIGADGREQTLARGDLEELVSSRRSLMPEGLERDLSAADLANVIAFIQADGPSWKRFDGNQPQVIQAAADGVITLPASAAEIYGPRLEFEPRHGNLGWWATTDDFAVWTFEARRSGHYTVEFEYACDNGSAGNLLRLSTGNRLLSARVPGTGTWEQYSRWTAGTLDVHAGRGRLTLTAAEPPMSHLIDVRAIRLIPPR